MSNYTNSKKLFNPIFGKKPFKAYTDQNFYVGSNPAREVKRALKEIAETVDNPILAYSGGMDSGFVLRCLADLKENEGFDKIDVYIGNFQSKDLKRAIRYAHTLNIDPKVIPFNGDDKDLEICYHISDNYLIKEPVSIFQEAWRRRIDGTIVKSVCCFGENVFPKAMDRYRMTCHKFIHHLPGGNSVDVFDWDLHTFSSMISPFLIKRSNIDVSPFGHMKNLYNPFNPHSYNSSLFKYLIYLNEYPDLFQIFFKFPTIYMKKYQDNQPLMEFIEYQKKRDVDYEFGWINVNGVDLTESNVGDLIDDPKNLL